MSAKGDIALRDIAVDAAREAGALALQHFEGDVTAWQKDNNTPVTKTDIEVDTLLRETLTAARPDFAWLSEETRDDLSRLGAEELWIVDPIDGTRAFVKGRPEWVISIAAVRDGKPVAGAIFNPVTDEMFEAVKGEGARLNGEPIAATSRTALEGCNMIGYVDMFNRKDWPRAWPPMEVGQRNAVAYRLALVASGAFDAMVTLNLKNEWDMAAGALIAQEAGALVTNHLGEPLKFNQPETQGSNLVCAGPALHAALVERVNFIPMERIVAASRARDR